MMWSLSHRERLIIWICLAATAGCGSKDTGGSDTATGQPNKDRVATPLNLPESGSSQAAKGTLDVSSGPSSLPGRALPPSPEKEEYYWTEIKKTQEKLDESYRRKLIRPVFEKATPEEKAQIRKEHEALVKDVEDYINSLSAEELILAGRACARELEAGFRRPEYKDRPPENPGYLLAFFGYRFRHLFDKSKHLSLLLEEVKDPSQALFWRISIAGMLLGGTIRSIKPSESPPFTKEETLMIFETARTHLLYNPEVLRIVYDDTQPITPRIELVVMLVPVVKEWLIVQSSKYLDPSGPKNQQKKYRTPFTDWSLEFTDLLLKWFSDPKFPVLLRQMACTHATDYALHGLPGSEKVQETLSQAFLHWQEYPEPMRQNLAANKIVTITVPIEKRKKVLDEMYQNTQDPGLKNFLGFQKRSLEQEEQKKKRETEKK